MLEQQRHQYLSILGIDQYIPQRMLLGAAESPVLSDDVIFLGNTGSADLLSSDAKPLVMDSVEGDGQALNHSSPAADNTLSEQPGVSPLDSLKEPANTDDQKGNLVITHGQQESDLVSESTEEKIHFVLTTWRIGSDFLVVDSRQPAAALPTDRLLQNMLRAMGHSFVQLPQSEIIRWPLFANPMGVNDPIADIAEAKAMVQAYISAQMNKSPFTALLLMGADAVNYALDTADSFEQQVGKCIFYDPWQLNVIVTPSLIHMLEEPLQKRVAWMALSRYLS